MGKVGPVPLYLELRPVVCRDHRHHHHAHEPTFFTGMINTERSVKCMVKLDELIAKRASGHENDLMHCNISRMAGAMPGPGDAVGISSTAKAG